MTVRWFRRIHPKEWRHKPRPWEEMTVEDVGACSFNKLKVPLKRELKKSSQIFSGNSEIMNESNTWEWLRDVALPIGSYSRVESPDTSPGIPDVFYQMPNNTMGEAGWIELKCNPYPATIPFPDEEKGLHKSQKKWINNHIANGGRAWIIAEVPGMLYLIHGRHANEFNGATHMDLHNMSIELLERDEPKVATDVLFRILRMPPMG